MLDFSFVSQLIYSPVCMLESHLVCYIVACLYWFQWYVDPLSSVRSFVHCTCVVVVSNCVIFLLTVLLVCTIHRQKNKLKFSIYRKPTQTDIIIPNDSCHPYEHKWSGINYLLNRLHTYPITEEAKDTEVNTIKNILQNNGYDRK
jgi:hypothetical protein